MTIKIETELQKMERIEAQCRAEGRQFCAKCGHIGGLKYIFKDGTSRGITLKKITVYENDRPIIKHICTECAKEEK